MKNKIYAILGPSSSGKTTVGETLFGKENKVITTTTRPRRPNEVDGEDYYFVTEGNFFRLERNKKLYEWMQYDEHYYGTLRDELFEKYKTSKAYVVVDSRGFHKLNEILFVIPIVLDIPFEVAKKRLEKRETDPEVIAKRLDQFHKDQEDLQEIKELHYSIVVDASQNLDDVLKYIRSFI